MIAHVIERVQAVRGVNEVVLATSESERDNALAQEGRARGAKVFRGSEWDVLGRMAMAAMRYEADIVMRFTGDTPLLCPFIAEEVLGLYRSLNGEFYTWNDVTRSGYPDGTDVECANVNMLFHAAGAAEDRNDREHCTPFIRRHYPVRTVTDTRDQMRWKLSVDTMKDFDFVADVFAHLSPASDFSFANTMRAVHQVTTKRVLA